MGGAAADLAAELTARIEAIASAEGLSPQQVALRMIVRAIIQDSESLDRPGPRQRLFSSGKGHIAGNVERCLEGFGED
jgi:hypothetical protein